MFYLSIKFIIRMFEVWGIQTALLFLTIMTITQITGDKAWLRKKYDLLKKYMFGEL